MMTLLPAPLASDSSILALEALAESISDLDPAPVLTNLVDLADASALPHLAYQFSLLDEPAWSLAESDEVRRNLIKQSILWHGRKGTPWAIREVCRLLGFGEIGITEGIYPHLFDGTWTFDGSVQLGGEDDYWLLDGSVMMDGLRCFGAVAGWAKYTVDLLSPITADQANVLQAAIESVAPARCELVAITFPRAAYLMNGDQVFDGSWTFNLYT
jgi:phage tail P2-like protein